MGFEDDDEWFDCAEKDDEFFGLCDIVETLLGFGDNEDESLGFGDNEGELFGLGDKDEEFLGLGDSEEDLLGFGDKDEELVGFGDKDEELVGFGDKDDELFDLGDKDDEPVGEYFEDCDKFSVLIVLGVINVTWLELALSGDERDEDPTNWACLMLDNSLLKFSFSFCNCFIACACWNSAFVFSVLTWRRWAAILIKLAFNLSIFPKLVPDEFGSKSAITSEWNDKWFCFNFCSTNLWRRSE